MICIYDVETLKNCFCVTFLDIKTEEVYQYVLHKSRNDRDELDKFLANCKGLIGFNNINFDWPVLREFMGGADEKKIYKVAQKLVTKEKNLPAGEEKIPQRDLMRIWHFANKGRYASLKWLQINMGFRNIQDMPIHHSERISESQIATVLEYNLNDVTATYELYKRSKDKIKSRQRLTEKYGIDMMNFSDPSVGEHIVLKMLSDKTGTSVGALKRCRTPRQEVRIADCILPKINFKTKEFQGILDYYNNLIVKKDEEINDNCVTFDSMDYYFGLGGIHAARQSGTYYNLSSCDVSGYYPSLAVAQRFSPAHLGDAFVEVYGEIAKERSLQPKGSEINKDLKLAQNAVFGKAGNEFSPFYDLMFLYKITINGQLALAMLCERLTINNAARIITANTDGIEVEIIDKIKFDGLCRKWEKLFGLKLEHSEYSKFVLRDINNYLAIKTNGEIKQKGCFTTSPELHQDHSMLVVPEALREYYTNFIPPEVYINNCTDISKFLIGRRARTGKFYSTKVENMEVVYKPLQKHLRYYISNRGEIVVKKTEKTESRLHANDKMTMFNRWVDLPEGVTWMYDVNKRFYIKECYKIINQI